MYKSQKGFSLVIIVLIVLIVLAAGGMGFVIYTGMQEQKTVSTSPIIKKTIQTILERSQNIQQIKYDLIDQRLPLPTDPKNPFPVIDYLADENYTIWMKPSYIRSDITNNHGEKKVQITTSEGQYTKVPGYPYSFLKEGYAFTVKENSRNHLIIPFLEKLRKNPSLQIDGTETIDGKLVTIIKYQTSYNSQYKVWVWEEKGVPLKIEEYFPGHDTSHDITDRYIYNNYSFDAISDDIFKIEGEVLR